jgi:DNA invertase Pin-like site-specific DNA recombinase
MQAAGPRAALVVSKMDRFTRSVPFLNRLLEAGVDVRFADLPQIEGATGRFMVQMMVSVAELEAGMISKRTKDALGSSQKARREAWWLPWSQADSKYA